MATKVSFQGKQVIIKTTSLEWGNIDKIIDSELFKTMLSNLLKKLREKKSEFLKLLPKTTEKEQEEQLHKALKCIAKHDIKTALKNNPELETFFKEPYLLDRFVEELYNYWRNHERYLICLQDQNSPDKEIDKKPYRTFNDTIEKLNHTVRKIYRDMQENITGEHPIIFRQVPAGCTVGAIAKKIEPKIPNEYAELKKIPMIRQILLNPPVIIDPLINKRKGEFKIVKSNPIENTEFNEQEWLCFPAKVGELIIYLYFHDFYTGMALSTANLFELCTDQDLKKKPDAIYVYGLPLKTFEKYYPEKTIYYIDEKNNLMIGAIPADKEFGYFGYIKKMMLTLHNSIWIKRGRMPIHGAMVRITMKTGKKANIILVGDSGAGKSESLEALRMLSGENLREMKIIFDDMGSLEIGKDGKIKAYGTEIGAFVRIDDLDTGYVYGQLDRMIIMIPNREPNARIIIPVTTLKEIQHGWNIDYFLYANNYEKPEDENYLQRFKTPEEAMAVFKEGKRLAKGTTQETGISTTYYANIFGPLQLKEEHEIIAEKYFKQMFKEGIYVGQIKTQLGLQGMELEGPKKAAIALFKEIMKNKNQNL